MSFKVLTLLSHTQGVYGIGTVINCSKGNVSVHVNQRFANLSLSHVAPNCTPPDYWSLDINQGFFDLVVSLKLSAL